MSSYLALDLGAGSGRAIVGTIENDKILLEEIHRFNNQPVLLGNTFYWDFLYLFSNIKEGIYSAWKKGYDLKGVAVDTWGVDFGIIDEAGKLLSNPVTYRDNRTSGMSQYVSKEQLYKITGIQQMEINTLFQLISLKKALDTTFLYADKLLFMPDLVNYFLTGISCNEYTIASTSQMLNAQAKAWDKTIFENLELPFDLTQRIIFPGNLIGCLSKDIAQETMAPRANVFAVGSHDTASAIGAIPAEGKNWAFLSSGTWSLLGTLNDEAILTEEAMNNDFTNEGGINDKILFMRNITGLWLLQKLLAEWQKVEGKSYDYNYLLSEANKALPFRTIVNSDYTGFANPASMAEAIQTFCKENNQPVPETKGEFVRCILESLAIKYYFVLEKLKKCTGKQIDKLHVVGGGSQNDLLNQFTANALGIEVSVEMTEATAIGNIMQQAIADKTVEDWNKGHCIIKNSFTSKIYSPKDTDAWKQIAEKTKHLF